MASQIPLPLETPAKLGRADFIVGPGNAAAAAFIDRWPDWPAPAAVLFGPSGSGKTHLSGAWAERAGAGVLDASDITHAAPGRPLVIESVDRAGLTTDGEAALFALLERGQTVILTAFERPRAWKVALPDLRSRCDALLAFPMWTPDDALLEALARKLFADRQLAVPDAVIVQMVRLLERSPGALRDFVAKADAAALAAKRAVTLGLIRELLAGN